MNKKPRLAWELYLKMETSSESFSVLQLIANDCYKVRHYINKVLVYFELSVYVQMEQYFYAAKAFDVLERLDPSPEYWDGKRGACIGVLEQIMNGKEPKDSLRSIVSILRNTSNPQVEYVLRVFKKVGREIRIAL